MERRERIKTSLLNQLKNKEVDIECFIDLIDDYMALWDIKSDLDVSIKKNGVSYVDYTATGSEIIKSNPLIKELVDTNKQMLVLLKELGLNTGNCIR